MDDAAGRDFEVGVGQHNDARAPGAEGDDLVNRRAGQPAVNRVDGAVVPVDDRLGTARYRLPDERPLGFVGGVEVKQARNR